MGAGVRGLSGVSVKGGNSLRLRPKPRLEPPSGKVLKTPKLHCMGQPNRTTHRTHPTVRLSHAVKFWEFLEPSPKEGSKRGLGQSPKVFFPPPFTDTPNNSRSRESRKPRR